MSEEIHYAIGRLEAKVDMLVQKVTDQRSEDLKERREMEQRIVRLEEWRWKIVGICSAVSGVAGIILPKLMSALTTGGP